MQIENGKVLNYRVKLSVSFKYHADKSRELADQHGRHVPLALKIAPDLEASQIIDIGRIEGLNTIELKGRSIVIGAMTKHADVANSPIVQENLPALAALAGKYDAINIKLDKARGLTEALARAR